MLALRMLVSAPRAARTCGVPQRLFTRKFSPLASRWYNKQPEKSPMITKSMRSVLANALATSADSDMSSVTTDIPIKFINATTSTDFSVCVFTQNFSVDTPEIYYTAWEVIEVQSSSEFVYPVSTSVGASYSLGDQCNTMGPLGASLGSTWEINQDNEDNAPILKSVTAPPNPNNTIVVKNTAPDGDTWPGRTYDVSVYKNDKILVTQPGVHVGSQADVELQPIVSFGVTRNLNIGDTFTSLDITEATTQFDLSQFPDGLVVTLTQEPVGGLYSFAGENMTS